VRKRGGDLEHVVSGLLGSVSSFAALKGEKSISVAMHSAQRAIERRLARRGEGFLDLVERKRGRLATVVPPDLSQGAGPVGFVA
jgi:hypothetical protein